MLSGHYTEAVHYSAAEKGYLVNPRTLSDLCSFAKEWMENIRLQQGLKRKMAA